MLSPKAKARTFAALSVVVALFAWCAMMALYLKAHDLIEQSAVPVSLQSKGIHDAELERWIFPCLRLL